MRTITLFFAFFCLFAFSLPAQTTCGGASYYPAKMNGNYTSTGETYRHNDFTCANSEFPVGTILRVTRFDDSRSVDVRVNDCVSPNSTHVVVLSGAAAKSIGLGRGTTQVSLSIVKMGTGELACSQPTKETPVAYETVSERPQAVVSIQGNGTFPAGIFEPINTGFGVQIGSYKSMENAREAIVEFESKGFKRLLVRASAGAYQVLIGPFDTEAAADVYRTNLSRRYKVNGFVTALGG
ncbi:MAG: septal ring lytic transglycosylase RlpA family protein [Bacteroidota bacterium]